MHLAGLPKEVFPTSPTKPGSGEEKEKSDSHDVITSDQDSWYSTFSGMEGFRDQYRS